MSKATSTPGMFDESPVVVLGQVSEQRTKSMHAYVDSDLAL